MALKYGETGHQDVDVHININYSEETVPNSNRHQSQGEAYGSGIEEDEYLLEGNQWKVPIWSRDMTHAREVNDNMVYTLRRFLSLANCIQPDFKVGAAGSCYLESRLAILER